MYVCSICKEEFIEANDVATHYLKCWKEKHPYQKSKDAPRGEDIEVRKVDNDIANFFNSFIGR